MKFIIYKYKNGEFVINLDCITDVDIAEHEISIWLIGDGNSFRRISRKEDEKAYTRLRAFLTLTPMMT